MTLINGICNVFTIASAFPSDGPEFVCKSSAIEWDTLENLCEVTGVPRPNVTWKKDEEPVSPTLRLSREYTGEYVMEAQGASLVRKRLQPAIYCEHPANIHFGIGPVQQLPSNACFHSQLSRSCFVRARTRCWSTLLTTSRARWRATPNLTPSGTRTARRSNFQRT